MQPGIQGALSGSLTGSIPIGSSIKFKDLPRVVRPFLIPHDFSWKRGVLA